MMKKNYFVIDAMNLAHRAHRVFYENKTASGNPSGMFYGFLSVLQSLKKKFRSYKFICVWDNKPYWKYEIVVNYKEGRTRLSTSVWKQIPNIKEYLANCNVDQYEKEGQEADDVIASLVEEFKGWNDTGNILIYSNDKDLLQLVESGKVTVFKPKVGISPEKYYDVSAVKERFGVYPDKLAEYRALDGDEGDTLKGVPRVRRKKIAACINEASSLEHAFELFETQGDFSSKERIKLKEFKPDAQKNYKIMKLVRNLKDIECIEACVNRDKLQGLLTTYEVKKINHDMMADLFESSLNIRYSDAKPAYKLESFSLFD